jgi:hypothetical protein
VWIRAAAGRQTDKARKEEEKTKKKNERIKKGKRKTQKNKKLIDGPICQCLIPKFKSSKQTKKQKWSRPPQPNAYRFFSAFSRPGKIVLPNTYPF